MGLQFPFPFIDVLTLPTDAGEGEPRIVLDGLTGTISFFDENGDLVGQLTPDQWAIGDLETPGARVTLDPSGGLRIRNASDVLVGVLDQAGYSLRDTTSGLVVAELTGTRLRIADPEGVNDIVASTVATDSLLTPRYASVTEASPSSSVAIPAVSVWGADDYELYHYAAALMGTSQAGTWTPPGGTTERIDSTHNTGTSTLSVGVSERDPATGALASATSSQTNWAAGIGTHVVVRGPNAAFRSSSSANFGPTTDTTLALSLSKPSGVAAGDVLVAFVSMHNALGTVPVGWTTPDGWVFLGAAVLPQGSGPTQETTAVGAWAKLAGSSEPADYSVTITFGDGGSKRLQATIIAIQGAVAIPGGAAITIGGYPMRRLIDEVELTANSVTLADFQNVPQNFAHYALVYQAVGAAASSGGTQNIQVRFNGDTGNNYHYQRLVDGVSGSGLSVSGILVGAIAGSALPCGGTIDILDYTEAVERPVLFHTTDTLSGDLQDIIGSGYWLNVAAAIDQITVQTTSALTLFGAGSRAWLFGW